VTSDPEEASSENSGDDAQQSIELVRRFAGDLLAHMELELSVAVSGEDRTITVNLTGPDRPMLLSNSASLLNSIEYLANKTFRTGKEEKITSILVDSDRYRQHREAELTLLARMASEKVIARRRPLVLQPMTPRERRIVHMALASIEGVRSESSGTGDHRSVTIYPAG
jgi:spoIIIJ-associated protein